MSLPVPSVPLSSPSALPPPSAPPLAAPAMFTPLAPPAPRLAPAQREAQVIEDLSIIEDAQERLAAVVARARTRPAWPATQRQEQHRVTGCISAVWLRGERERPLDARERADAADDAVAPAGVVVPAGAGAGAGAGDAEGVRVRFFCDAESPLVKALVVLLVDLYDGATVAEILATEPVLFDTLGLTAQLTSTRRQGLAAVRARLRQLAAALA